MKERKQLPSAIEEAFEAMDATIHADEIHKHSLAITRYLAKHKDQYLQARYHLSMCRYHTLTKGHDKVRVILQDFITSRIAAREPQLMGLYHYQSSKLCYLQNDGTGALRHAEQAIEVFRQLDDSKWQCHCFLMLYNTCASFQIPHHYDPLELLWNIVSLCDQAGLNDEVMVNSYTLACSGIATQYLMEEKYEAAHNFLQTPYAKLTEIGSVHAQSIYAFIGESYFYEKRYPQALKILTEVYNNEFRLLTNPFNAHVSYLLIACHIEMGSFREHQKYYDNYIAVAELMNVPYENVKVAIVKAYKAALKKDKKTLNRELQAGLELIEKHKMGDHLYRLYYYSTSKAHEAAGDHKSALEALNLYTQYLSKSKSSITDKKIEILQNRIEMTKRSKENELLKKELELHSRELELTTTFLKKKNALIGDMLTFTTALCKKHKHQNGLFEVKKKLIGIRSDDDDRDKIKELLDKNNQDYIRSITTKYSAITNAEAKVCALIKTGLSNKEIASLLVSSPRTIDTHRSNIRKKMGLLTTDNLERVLRGISNSSSAIIILNASKLIFSPFLALKS